MRIYNSLSHQFEEVVPYNPPVVGLYACGITVYDYAHIGNLQKYCFDDVLVRTLKHAGFQVKHVQNITDVGHLVSDDDAGEDKMEKGARKYGKTVWDVAHEFEEYFWKQCDAMNFLRPTVSCRATDHIQEQIALIQQLEKNGFTYTIDDGVYFDTSKDATYGELAGLKNKELLAGARVEMVEGKKHPTDFALWKFSPKNEKRQMEWDSPWGVGFPGWHIECSAMSMKYLGEQFEIHTGGIDHLTIHHPNEIAQSECATGKRPFVKYWMHQHFMMVDGKKMSKSLGNVYKLEEIIARGFDPMVLRLFFLSAHYRSELNFTFDALNATKSAYSKLISAAATYRDANDRTELSEEKLAQIDTFRTRFFAAMEDDLKTPEALAVMWEMMKSNVPSRDKYDLLVEFDEVLGLRIVAAVEMFLQRGTEIAPDDVQALARQREEARKSGDWARADQLRGEIEQKGWTVVDTANGFEVKRGEGVASLLL